MHVYKNDVVRTVAQETQLSQRAVRDALTSTLTVIVQALQAGKTVTLPGFGTFYTSTRAAGRITHIRTGETITVPARRVAAFRVGELLKKSVRNTKPEKRARRSRLGFIRGRK
ncbi:MAG TPA: HU family DNA-binding protein [Chloroflexota bacterium]|jgi:DNA-binding protein HU-beta